MEDQFFAGIDAHMASLQVAVLSRYGAPVLETRVPTEDSARLLEMLALSQSYHRLSDCIG